MHWLQSLDIAIFHFINGTLSNPFFDWLMPLLSGGNGAMRWFVLVIVAAFIVTLCIGNARARLCALMIFLVIALGDPLVVNTIKHAVARPRPCLVLPDDIERLGCTHSGSMPSAHAANWFAATMVAFLFYRRSLWFILPVALAVSFSRVYNGVHYPSDVLAGAILGAGYAAAGVIALQAIWNFAGKKWFPLWHEQLPNLLNSESKIQSSESETQNSKLKTENSSLVTHHSPLDSHWLRLGSIVIFVLLVARWIYLASNTIGLSQDEAYQWVWSKHLALSYYSKPLGIALIQFVSTHIFSDTEFGVRFFSPLFAAILSVLVLRFLAKEIGARLAFWLLLIVTATPLLSIGTILMTIDPPLVLCWTWALVVGWRAVQPDGKTRDWLVVGLAMGLGFLCKYSAAYQLVCWAVFFALCPMARAQLKKSGPWLALLVFFICTLPVVVWNWQHGWITVHHVAGDAGMHSQWKPTLRYFWDFTFQEFGLLNPIFLIGALWAMIGFWKFRRERPLWLYFFCMGTPVFLGHWLFSFHSRVLPNWIAPAVLPMFCLMLVYWNEHRRAAKVFLTIGLALGFFVVILAHQTNLIAKITGEPLPPEKDPLRRVRAWKIGATLVETEREKLQQQMDKPVFIICSHYGITGEFSFYSPEAKAELKTEPLVYCVDSDQPVSQFYFWPEYNYLATRKGENAIYVSEVNPYPLERDWLQKWLAHEPVQYREIPAPDSAPPEIMQEFQSVTDLGVKEIKMGDRVFHRVHLWACYDLK